MGIESNKEAYQMVKNTLGSIENRFREAYNKGYKDGIKEGINQAMQKIADSILEEIKADRKGEPTISKMEQVDKDINVRSKDEPYIDIETGILHWCGWKYKRIYEDEPQTDLVNDSQVLAKDLVDDEFNPYDEECMPRCSVNGTPFDECGFCEYFNCDTCKCEADVTQMERRSK